MTSTTATRRAMFGILATPVAALALPTACYEARATDNRTAWDQAFAAFQRAKAAADNHQSEIDAAHEKFERLKPDLAMIPWREFPFEDRNKVAITMDLEDRWAKFLEGEGKWWFAPDAAKRKAEYRAGLDKIAEYRRLHSEAEECSGYNAAWRREDELCDALDDAEERLILTPAPDAKALLWKLEYVIPASNDRDFSDNISMEYVNAIKADVRRLAGEAQA